MAAADDINSWKQSTDNRTAGISDVWPQVFTSESDSTCLNDPLIGKLVSFFQAKGLAAIKHEDRCEQWYDDWLEYQAQHRLYASLLSPRQYSAHGGEFDLLRLARFLEVFGYFSPARGYSLQVTLLGLTAILAGANDALKQEAVAVVDAGGLLAFGVSERQHGSDLLGNEFTVKPGNAGQLLANGSKYYIGNANCATLIAVLARKESEPIARNRRAMPILIALRPKQSPCLQNVRKIRTLGVRSAFVGAFDVKDHELPEADVIAQGRDAWEAVFAAITLGKFLLGFGAIGICEHAFEEGAEHLRKRVLYGKPVIGMPHIRSAATQAYVRLMAMKLFAYRAIDYLQVASAVDRRYLLFNAVQKAKVSTEGVKVIALLSECVGAKGFESDTYFEMALRDIQLIPGLESSTHINLALIAQFLPQYLEGSTPSPAEPKSLIAGETSVGENPYLFHAQSGSLNTITFPPFLKAYGSLRDVTNVQLFAKQADAFRLFVQEKRLGRAGSADIRRADAAVSLPAAQCLAIFTYGQLIAENSLLQHTPRQIISAVFQLLVLDMNAAAMSLGASSDLNRRDRYLIRRMIKLPKTSSSDWDFVFGRVEASWRSSSQDH